MKKDKFNILFYGKLLPGYQKEAVILQFTNTFKINHNKVSAWFSSNKIIIKKALSYQKAIQYQKAFAKLGAVCELQVVTDALSFKNALVKPYSPKNPLLLIKNTNLSDKIAQKEDELPTIYKFDRHFCQPKILGTSMLMEVKNEKEETCYEVIAEKKKIGTLSVFAISLFIAFIFQNQLISFMLSSGYNSSLLTAVALISFFSIVFITPKLLWSQRSYTLSNHEPDNTEEALNSSLSQITNYRYFKQKYTLDNSAIQTLHLKYSRSQKKIQCVNSRGVKLFSAERDKDLDNLLLQSSYEHSKQLLDFDFMSDTKITSSFATKHIYSIRDYKQNIVAVYHPGKINKLIINPQAIDKQLTPVFISIAMILSGI